MPFRFFSLGRVWLLIVDKTTVWGLYLSCGAWLSLVERRVQGREGRTFKSCRPDQCLISNPGFDSGFFVFPRLLDLVALQFFLGRKEEKTGARESFPGGRGMLGAVGADIIS